MNVCKQIVESAKNDIKNNPNTKINDLKLTEQVAPADNAAVKRIEIVESIEKNN